MKYFKLFENWNGDKLTDAIDEASIFDDKYDSSHSFVLSRDKKNSGEDFFKKTFRKLPSGVLHKTNQVKLPKKFIHIEPKAKKPETVYITDGKDTWQLTDSTNKLKNWFNKAKSNPKDITWNEKTLESAACLGLYFDPQPWINDLQSGDIPKAAKAEVAAVKEIRGLLNKGTEYRGAYEILSKIDNITITDLVKTLVLANGGHLFAIAHNCKDWNFIHKSITEYYDAEMANPTIQITGSKTNTADTIFFDGKSVDAFIDEVESDPITSDPKTGLCTTKTGTKFYQISNKESEKNSQLGRIKEVIDKAYGLPVGKDRFELELQNESICTKDFDEAYELAVNEGLGKWIGQAVKWTKDTFTSFVAKIKEKLQTFSSSILDTLGVGTTTTTPPKPLDDFIKSQINEGLLTEGLSYGEYATDVTTEFMNGNTERLSNLFNRVNEEWTTLKDKTSQVKGLKLTPDSGGPTLPNKISSLEDGKNLTIKYMIDYSAYYDLNAMFSTKEGEIKDASTILDDFVEFEKEMVFGKTELPVYKLYGSNGTNKKPWTYLSSGRYSKAKEKR